MVYESRTHKLARERRERAAQEVQQEVSADLEAHLEASERRALRLAKELLDETTMRIRAEKTRSELEEQLEELKEQISELEKFDAGFGKPKKITRKPKSKPITAGGAGKEDPAATSTSGENSSGERPIRGSARKRGGVK